VLSSKRGRSKREGGGALPPPNLAIAVVRVGESGPGPAQPSVVIERCGDSHGRPAAVRGGLRSGLSELATASVTSSWPHRTSFGVTSVGVVYDDHHINLVLLF
jgi:hypothetical protein